ncbi:hypothetical protein CDAR_251641 [Caerostris darwini]|uniref:Uncharacterized protein n=1 Tax=Caerostris darwini TaxID=1538125 RepID=A0AAV4RBM5_9ARAC|nr:hypothetical protein CDAR_251641 [Caerostris darwini]
MIRIPPIHHNSCYTTSAHLLDPLLHLFKDVIIKLRCLLQLFDNIGPFKIGRVSWIHNAIASMILETNVDAHYYECPVCRNWHCRGDSGHSTDEDTS